MLHVRALAAAVPAVVFAAVFTAGAAWGQLDDAVEDLLQSAEARGIAVQSQGELLLAGLRAGSGADVGGARQRFGSRPEVRRTAFQLTPPSNDA